jgi:hypothetical protein
VVPPKKKYVICRSMTTPAEFVMDQSPFRPTPFDRNLLHRPGRKDAAVGAGGLAVGGDPHLAVRDDPRAAGPALVGLLVTDWPRFVHGTPLMGFRTSSPLESSLWHDDNSAGTKTPWRARRTPWTPAHRISARAESPSSEDQHNS